MTLSDITFKDSKKFEFLNPATNESFDKKVYFTITSPSSKRAKNVILQTQRKIFELMQDSKNIIDDKLNPELLDLMNRKYLLELIEDWENVTDEKGKKLECNDKNKEQFIINDFVCDFVGKQFQTLANFR